MFARVKIRLNQLRHVTFTSTSASRHHNRWYMAVVLLGAGRLRG